MEQRKHSLRILKAVATTCMALVLGGSIMLPATAATFSAPHDEATALDSTYIFTAPDVAAQFPGGDEALDQYIASHITTVIPDSILAPIKQLGGKIHARCIVRCVIETDGSVTGATIERTTSSLLFDNEALRVVSTLPSFIPAKVYGRPVRAFMLIPVTFDY